MILVDSSVLIRALGGRQDSTAVEFFSQVIAEQIPFAICPFVYQEVLQGTGDEVTYRRVKNYLDTQECLWLPPTLETHAKAAKIYWDLRRQGVTVRSTIDVLIALTALHHGALLLHDDRDFDQMSAHIPDLRICEFS